MKTIGSGCALIKRQLVATSSTIGTIAGFILLGLLAIWIGYALATGQLIARLFQALASVAALKAILRCRKKKLMPHSMVQGIAFSQFI